MDSARSLHVNCLTGVLVFFFQMPLFLVIAIIISIIIWHFSVILMPDIYVVTYLSYYPFIHFTSAVVAVVFSQLSVSSAALWSDYNLLSNSVNGHVLIMWFMGFGCPHSQPADLMKPHLCKFRKHGP